MILQAWPVKSSGAPPFLLCCQTLATDLLLPTHPCFHSGWYCLQSYAYRVGLSIHPSSQTAPFLTKPTYPPLPEHSLHVAAPAIQTVPASLRLSLLLSSWSSPQSC